MGFSDYDTHNVSKNYIESNNINESDFIQKSAHL